MKLLFAALITALSLSVTSYAQTKVFAAGQAVLLDNGQEVDTLTFVIEGTMNKPTLTFWTQEYPSTSMEITFTAVDWGNGTTHYKFEGNVGGGDFLIEMTDYATGTDTGSLQVLGAGQTGATDFAPSFKASQ